jgi:hypothetical protein
VYLVDTDRNGGMALTTIKPVDRWLIGALIVVCLGQEGIDAQERSDSVSRTQRLVTALFPELAAERVEVSVTLTGRFAQDWSAASYVGVVVGDGAADHDGKQREPRLIGHIDLSSTGDFSARFFGSHIETKAMDSLVARVKQHPEWSDEEIGRAVADAGARYGPTNRADLLLRVNSIDLVSLVGKSTMTEVSFFTRTRYDNAHDDIMPKWLVKLRTVGQRGKPACFGLLLEPFNGRVQTFKTISCEPK